jgi:hypothetical protein
MKTKILILLIVVAMILSVAAVKPPRLVRLEVVNKSGEPVYIELTGTGYDFNEMAHIWAGGSYWWLAHQDPPVDALGDYLKVTAYGVYTVPKDRYIINMYYHQELYGEVLSNCLANYVPDGYENGVAYWDQDRNRKMVIGKCNVIPKNLPGPKNDVFKWARWLLVVK